MRKEFQFRIVFKMLLQVAHVDRHDRADGLATCKKEVCHIYLSFKILLANRVTVLIYQFEIRYPVIPADFLQSIIDQPGVYVHGIVHWQLVFGLYQKKNNRDKKNAEKSQKDKCGPGFLKKFN